MSAAHLHLSAPAELDEYLRPGKVRQALAQLANLAGADLTVQSHRDLPVTDPESTDNADTIPIDYRGKELGRVSFALNDQADDVTRAADSMARLLEHMVDRERAVSDLADAMFTCYDELTMLYTLLPKMASKAYPREIAEVLVEETARTLNCRRVSLMVLDENGENIRVLASCGLPPEARNICIPILSSDVDRAASGDESLIGGDRGNCPDLAALSEGDYGAAAFEVMRVPLRARGETVGVLTATERLPSADFTARDRKLMDGLSAMGASALMNCRLHAAVTDQMLSTIQALASAVDAKDQYTHDHSGRVAELCVATALEMGVNDTTVLREMELAGLLHDIGKIGIPDSILTKNGPLTHEEFAIAKTHVNIGASIVEQVRGLERVAEAILHHHERYDGMGYPSGLAADAIPFASKLIAVSDVFDTLTSDRPYRKASTTEFAIGELRRSAETHLDPTIVNAFMSVIQNEDVQDTSPD